MKKILFLVNVDWFFLSHRLPIALCAMQEGYEVHLACEYTGNANYISSLGIIVHQLSFTRSGISLKSELCTLIKMYQLFTNIKPDLVHSITIKPVLYGGLIARITKINAYVAAISGLGLVFVAEGFRAIIIKKLVKILYRISFNHKNIIAIFQNNEDKKILISAKIIKEKQARLIKGSGVDLSEYRFQPEPVGVVKVIMAARLLREKGVSEFIEVAKKFKERTINVQFTLVGEPDLGNPNSYDDCDLNKWKSENYVNILGHRNDIADLFSASNIVVLPSYYGEGLPKVLIEAAACGRAIVTTKKPGCRDAVIENKTGILVSIKDSEALYDAILKLVENKKLRYEMGEAGREYAEKEFDIKQVINKHLEIYKELLSK